MKKTRFLLTIAATVAIVSSPCMAIHFDGGAGAGNPNWNAALNWSDDNVPTSATDVQAIALPGYGVEVNNSGAQALYIQIGIWGHPGYLNVALAGTLTTAGNFNIANDAGKTGVVTNNGQINIGDSVYMMKGIGSLVNNGTLTANQMILGHEVDSICRVSNTGTMNINGNFYLSRVGSDSVFNMNGGNLNTDRLEMPNGGVGHLNLHGGVITNAVTALNSNGDYTIEVGLGEMYTSGDTTGDLDSLIGLGLITGKDFRTPYSSFDGSYTKLASIPEPATLGLLSLLGLAILRKK